MKKLKYFIYLDTRIMYSLSAQLFEGLTENIVNKTVDSQTESEDQKGEIFSGRVLGDIVKKESETTELKFLHDYSYTIFEEKVIGTEKVIEFPKNNEMSIEKIEEFSFIKITGYPRFVDIKRIREIAKEFNQYGESLEYITTFEERNFKINELNEQLWAAQGKDRKRQIQNEIARIKDVSDSATKKGLRMDDDFLNRLALVLEFGYKDSFEIRYESLSENDSKNITAIIDRNYLKENEESTIRKYSRISSKPITLLGIITQTEKNRIPIEEDEDNNKQYDDMRDAIENLSFSITGIETTFTGKKSNEVIVNPIAIYQEL